MLLYQERTNGRSSQQREDLASTLRTPSSSITSPNRFSQLLLSKGATVHQRTSQPHPTAHRTSSNFRASEGTSTPARKAVGRVHHLKSHSMAAVSDAHLGAHLVRTLGQLTAGNVPEVLSALDEATRQVEADAAVQAAMGSKEVVETLVSVLHAVQPPPPPDEAGSAGGDAGAGAGAGTVKGSGYMALAVAFLSETDQRALVERALWLLVRLCRRTMDKVRARRSGGVRDIPLHHRYHHHPLLRRRTRRASPMPPPWRRCPGRWRRACAAPRRTRPPRPGWRPPCAGSSWSSPATGGGRLPPPRLSLPPPRLSLPHASPSPLPSPSPPQPHLRPPARNGSTA